jgi:hypothetical protein
MFDHKQEHTEKVLHVYQEKIHFANDQIQHFVDCHKNWQKLYDDFAEELKEKGKVKDEETFENLKKHMRFAQDSIRYWKLMRDSWKEYLDKLLEDVVKDPRQINLDYEKQEKSIQAETLQGKQNGKSNNSRTNNTDPGTSGKDGRRNGSSSKLSKAFSLFRR